MRTVAALYVDPLGPYPKLPGVYCWDEERDAKTYEGPHPVVAHPPCAPWSRMRWMSPPENRAKYRECALRAVAQVRRFGGVLEHPEHSLLWETMGLPSARAGGVDECGGRSWFVNQVSWAHPCSKPTWLYTVGIDAALVLRGLRFGGTATHCITRGPGQVTRLPVAHAAMRSRSPRAFAEWLVSLAREART